MAKKHNAMIMADPRPAPGVSAVVRLAVASSVAVAVTGLALTTAAGHHPRDIWQMLVTLAAFPWAILALLLVTALCRQAAAGSMRQTLAGADGFPTLSADTILTTEYPEPG